MTAKEIREMSGLKRVDFCKKYDIPLRTMENWEAETTKAPKYVLDLLERAVREDFMSQQNIGHWISSSEYRRDVLPKYEAEVITRGNCMMCGKELTEGLFFCKECEDKASSRK